MLCFMHVPRKAIRANQNNYIPSGSPISVLHWPLSCDLCRNMPSAEQDLEQHEDIIPSGCYGEFHVELSIQNTVKRRMLLLTYHPVSSVAKKWFNNNN